MNRLITIILFIFLGCPLMAENKQAKPLILNLLNSLKKKDKQLFVTTLSTTSSFIDVLPGGQIINNPQELVEKHQSFFKNKSTKFEPLNRSPKYQTSFNEDHFSFVISTQNVYQVGVKVKVTRPINFEDKDETESFNNHLTITALCLDAKKQDWYIASIVNTLIHK